MTDREILEKILNKMDSLDTGIKEVKGRTQRLEVYFLKKQYQSKYKPLQSSMAMLLKDWIK